MGRGDIGFRFDPSFHKNVYNKNRYTHFCEIPLFDNPNYFLDSTNKVLILQRNSLQFTGFLGTKNMKLENCLQLKSLLVKDDKSTIGSLFVTGVVVLLFAIASANARGEAIHRIQRETLSQSVEVPSATIVSKNLGVFSMGYGLEVKTQKEHFTAYVAPEMFALVEPGNTVCLEYRQYKEERWDFSLCDYQ